MCVPFHYNEDNSKCSNGEGDRNERKVKLNADPML